MIQVENLTKTINNQMILEDISIDIEKGKLTSLIGPNGAGKSTFAFSAICRLIRFDNGEVKIDGQLSCLIIKIMTCRKKYLY